MCGLIRVIIAPKNPPLNSVTIMGKCGTHLKTAIVIIMMMVVVEGKLIIVT